MYMFKNEKTHILRVLNQSLTKKLQNDWTINTPLFTSKDIKKINYQNSKIHIHFQTHSIIFDMPVLSISELREIKRFINEEV